MRHALYLAIVLSLALSSVPPPVCGLVAIHTVLVDGASDGVVYVHPGELVEVSVLATDAESVSASLIDGGVVVAGPFELRRVEPAGVYPETFVGHVSLNDSLSDSSELRVQAMALDAYGASVAMQSQRIIRPSHLYASVVLDERVSGHGFNVTVSAQRWDREPAAGAEIEVRAVSYVSSTNFETQIVGSGEADGYGYAHYTYFPEVDNATYIRFVADVTSSEGYQGRGEGVALAVPYEVKVTGQDMMATIGGVQMIGPYQPGSVFELGLTRPEGAASNLSLYDLPGIRSLAYGDPIETWELGNATSASIAIPDQGLYAVVAESIVGDRASLGISLILIQGGVLNILVSGDLVLGGNVTFLVDPIGDLGGMDVHLDCIGVNGTVLAEEAPCQPLENGSYALDLHVPWFVEGGEFFVLATASSDGEVVASGYTSIFISGERPDGVPNGPDHQDDEDQRDVGAFPLALALIIIVLVALSIMVLIFSRRRR